ncbi:MAG: hypothetical protein WBX26_03980 [Candidatus Cybelea sp.]
MRRSCAIRGSVSPSIDIHAEFFPVETTNARCNVVYLTISIAGNPDDSRRDAIEAFAQAQGGRATWRFNPSAGRSYALLELPDGVDLSEVSIAPTEVAYETAVIAWAVFPTVPEALPNLYAALGGPGRPVGVLACRPCPQGAIVEWDPDSGGIEIIMKLVDVELRRFCSGRRGELLSPLTPRLSAKIAASGMSAPEIAVDRILELLIDA